MLPRFLLRRLLSQQKIGLKKAEKALVEFQQKQTEREQSVADEG
jgi:hypothetical protein